MIDVNEYKLKVKTKKGVRQYSSLPPHLFHVCTEEPIERMKNKSKGVKVNGTQIHYIRFADDQLAESENNITINFKNIIEGKVTEKGQDVDQERL